VQLHPLVASAAMRFDAQLTKMPAYRARAQRFAAALRGIDGLAVVPDPPQVNMFHLHFPVPQAALSAARDELAAAHGAWLLGRAAPGAGPGASSTEIYVADNLLALADADLVPLYTRLLERARAIAAASAS